jgi:hypothetical protein
VEGSKRWYAEKLTNIPDIVINETEKYISESNSFGEMINDLCDINLKDDSYYVPTCDIFKICQEKYKYKGSIATFTKEIKEQGIECCLKKIHGKVCRIYKGIKIKKDDIDQ